MARARTAAETFQVKLAGTVMSFSSATDRTVSVRKRPVRFLNR
jgi:hypothetical protein